MEPTPAYHFFELFCGILSQHLTSKTVEAALNRLVEVHKWQKCLKQKVSYQRTADVGRSSGRCPGQGQDQSSYWYSKIEFQHQLIAWACIIEQLNELEERYLSQELSQMIKVIQTNLNVSTHIPPPYDMPCDGPYH